MGNFGTAQIQYYTPGREFTCPVMQLGIREGGCTPMSHIIGIIQRAAIAIGSM